MGRLLLKAFVRLPLFLAGTVIGGLVLGILLGLAFDYLVLRFFFAPSDYLPILSPICLIIGLAKAGSVSWNLVYGQTATRQRC